MLETRMMMAKDVSTAVVSDSAEFNDPVKALVAVVKPSISVSDGVLRVSGSSNDDVIRIWNSYKYVQFDINSAVGIPIVKVSIDDAFGNTLVANSVSPAHVSEIVVHAYGGNDSITNDTAIASEIHGGLGNDNLYGGRGADSLYGEEGRDGLFGAEGTDVLDGGPDSDRFLQVGGAFDPLVGMNTYEDVRIDFFDGQETYKEFPSIFQSGLVEAGAWTTAEIRQIDMGLQSLHHRTRNNHLLRYWGDTSYQGLNLFRHGETSGSLTIGGWNNSTQIHLTQRAFDGGVDGLLITFFHEVGHHHHNAANAYWNDFKALSSWTQAAPGSQDFVASKDGNWWHHVSAKFAEEYGRTNPREDFATSFAAYFADRQGMPHPGTPALGANGVGAAEVPTKIALLHTWLNSVSTFSTGHWGMASDQLLRAVRTPTSGLAATAIDRWSYALANNTADMDYDLTSDRVVDESDIDILISQFLETRKGDTNLDGAVDFVDLLTLSRNYGATDASWFEGDSDGDGVIGFADFLLLSENFGFTRAAAD